MLAQVALAPDRAAELRSALIQLAPLAAVSLALYARWVMILKKRGGGVSTERFGLPDLFITYLVGGFLMLGAYQQFTAAKSLVFSVDALVSSTITELLLLTILVGFLLLRRIDVPQFLGWRLSSPAKLAGRAALFLLCAYPIVALVGVLMAGGSHDVEEQKIVSYFRERAKFGDFRGLIAVSLTAVVVAPLFEECFFRGYFYPTLKRYAGPVVASVIVSAAFACMHANLAALPSLFALALCLTIAYEWTGSLFASMMMHALFNAINLLLMYVTVGKPPAPPAFLP